MDILGIGPLELLFIFLIALIVLGPNDMVKAGRTLGRTLRKIVTSPIWRSVQDTSRQIRNLPNQMMREAGLEEMKELNELKNVDKELRQSLKVGDQIGRDLKDKNAPSSAQVSDGLEDWIPTGEDGPTIGTPPTTPEQTIAPPNRQEPKAGSPASTDPKEKAPPAGQTPPQEEKQ